MVACWETGGAVLSGGGTVKKCGGFDKGVLSGGGTVKDCGDGDEAY